MRVVAFVAFALASPRAFAEDPWAKGVAKDQQKRAEALFAEANDLFAKQAHAPALEKYKAALALWDHPLIRFNTAVTEIRLDRILDAADDLERALAYGDKPFPSKELYQQALDYQALVKGRVGEISASCDQPDVHLLLDGKPWFVCPGAQKSRVIAGEHVIVGERKNFLTRTRRLVVAGGATIDDTTHLVPLDTALGLEYRYAHWLPFTIAGSGAAIALGGLAVWFAGRSQMDKFNSQYMAVCPNGCDDALNLTPQEQQLASIRSSALLKDKIAIGMMAGGGAITVAGAIMAVVNKAKRVLPPVEVAPTTGGGVARVGWQF